ncbi:Cytochrome c-type biogenesis protein DsbD, protein-disulfide reductase [Caenispirillum salinarum AK4]|uniref:Cytochrome c-type biogenesis protein DsbD, protein-disulfide reductase n=2 Tax=Caenispirillum TaxID=414051 RepID=K9GVV5_9PROT|nr:Cytochrome c-type biogenesis protein DsbD, protein-disulfide reductase [Caenispirillum salinarum AK4]
MRIMRSRLLAAGAACLLGFAAAGASAATGPTSSGKESSLHLLSSVNGTGQLESLPAGLDIRLDNGWKTYWRSPGDAGIPPAMDWTGSENVAAVAVRWPVPRRFSTLGIETLGYKNEVVLPLDVKPERPGEPVLLRGRIDLLVCSDICVPASHTVRLDLPAGAATADAAAVNRIARFEAQAPARGAAGDMAVTAAWAEPEKKTLSLRITSASAPLRNPDVFIEGGDRTFGRPEVSLKNSGMEAVLALPVLAGPDPVGLPGTSLTATVVDGSRAIEAEVAVAPQAPAGSGWIVDLLPVLGLALLGGLVLNLMPCVLPVLSLKLMAIIDQQGQARRRIRLGFLVTSAGAISAMLVLAGLLATFKTAGGAVGWGMQFQQPIFISSMVLLLTVFMASMMGAFEIHLPAGAATRLGAAGGNGLLGHFASGAFATLLATPCSAPFLGTAVGFALARGPLEILAVFSALGIGLAIPYLLVAAFPGAIDRLPRPGRWMRLVRYGLAAALAGTALWLLGVLAVQTSAATAAISGGAAILAAAALTVYLKGRRLLKMVATPLAVAAAILTIALPGVMGAPAVAPGEPGAGPVNWQHFERAKIGKLVAEGRTVFVDVTADWCVTCIVNKKMVIERDPVAATLASLNVIALQADMTAPDAEIAAYLAQHDRYGIPFNIVYGPAAPRGIPLPEVLTEEAVMDAIGKADTAS